MGTSLRFYTAKAHLRNWPNSREDNTQINYSLKFEFFQLSEHTFWQDASPILRKTGHLLT